MWRPSLPNYFLFLHREKYGSHQKFRWYRGVFFGKGVTLGVCCTNGLDFLFFFIDLTIDDGMGPKLCLMDGWMGKDDMCLSHLLS